MIKPIVIISAPAPPELEAELDKYFEVDYDPAITYDRLFEKIKNAEGLIVTTRMSIDANLIDAAQKLKWIGRMGSGMELIDAQYARAKGIEVVSSPEGNRNAVAEHALGMTLSLLHRIQSSAQEVKMGQWNRVSNRGTELKGKTVGIIGYGNTGSQFAKLLAPFEVVVMAHDINKHDFARDYIKEATPDQIQRYADIISFHVPLDETTEGMANHEFFEGLQQQPLILNTSRGKVVELDALKNALMAGRISGAALDVLPNEAPATYSNEEKELMNWFYYQPNVLITPHIAGYSAESYIKMGQVVVDKLKHLFP